MDIHFIDVLLMSVIQSQMMVDCFLAILQFSTLNIFEPRSSQIISQKFLLGTKTMVR